jgi:hypothetical protein
MYKNGGPSVRRFTCILDVAGAYICCNVDPLCGDVGFGSTYTFWRFQIHIPLAESEMKILYSINDGLMMDFFVPSYLQTMRLAAYSVSDPNYCHTVAS